MYRGLLYSFVIFDCLDLNNHLVKLTKFWLFLLRCHYLPFQQIDRTVVTSLVIYLGFFNFSPQAVFRRDPISESDPNSDRILQCFSFWILHFRSRRIRLTEWKNSNKSDSITKYDVNIYMEFLSLCEVNESVKVCFHRKLFFRLNPKMLKIMGHRGATAERVTRGREVSDLKFAWANWFSP